MATERKKISCKEEEKIPVIPTVYVGIDPGKKGCLCIYNPEPIDNQEMFTFIDWPKSNNIREITFALDKIYFKYFFKGCILEKVNAMPGQGVTSMFSFGMNYGIWQGILSCFNIPYMLLTPGQWHKNIVTKKDGKDAKEAVYNVCTRMFPDYIDMLKGPRGGYKDGRGDAMLLAYVAKERFKGN